jgi:hypothetical protein
MCTERLLGVLFVILAPCALEMRLDPYLDVLVPGYCVETYATCEIPDREHYLMSMTWDCYGNLYLGYKLPHDPWAEVYGFVDRLAPDRSVARWIERIPSPAKMVWAGDFAHGGYLYIASGTQAPYSGILRSDLSGNLTTFAPTSAAPYALALDTTGNYGGYMYTATRVLDRTYRIDPNGNVALFSDFPKPTENGGGPRDIAFDPGTAYGGRMYMTTDFSDQVHSGLFVLDSSGKATRFVQEITGGYDVEIDPVGLHFSGDMFVTARVEQGPGDPFVMYRVTPAGGLSEFARGLADSTLVAGNRGLTLFAFGPDGAMYIPQVSFAEGVIVIRRVSCIRPWHRFWLRWADGAKPGSP